MLASDFNSNDDFRIVYYINSSAKILYQLILNTKLSIDVAKGGIKFKLKFVSAEFVNQVILDMCETLKIFVIEKKIAVFVDKLKSEKKKELACDWKLYNASLFTLIRLSLNSSQ